MRTDRRRESLGDVRLVGLCVTKRLNDRFDRALNEVFNEAFELGARNVHIEVLRTSRIGRDVRQIDFRFLTARELDLGLFGSILQTLQREDVLREVGARILRNSPMM